MELEDMEIDVALMVQECSQCGSLLDRDGTGIEWGDWWCDECKRRYPESLLKAVGDYFEYALQLRSGQVIYFSQATIKGEWVELCIDAWSQEANARNGMPLLERGVDVRMSDIVWCADAPNGS